MAEAIATLSLVCNMMQVISFSGEVFRLYHNTVRDHSPDSSLASNTAHLSALLETLQERLKDYNPIYSNTRDESEGLERQAKTRLQSLTSDLIRDTKELQKLLEKVTTTASAGKLGSLRAVMKFKFRYNSQISSLERKINGTRSVMDSELLSRICSSTQASHCLSEDMYSNLYGDIKQFIDRWSNGERTISKLLVSEAQKTRVHVTAESENIRSRIDAIDSRLLSDSTQRNLEELRKRILSTLWFPEMNQRESTIKEASDDIALRIFPDSDFADWLRSDRSDTPIFWISGKPGSGKSTLTKYLIRSSRTIEYLRTWDPSVRIFRFYFYALGQSPLQKQLRGCLRTLLHQVITENPDTLTLLLEGQPEVKEKASEHDWPHQELLDALSICLRDITYTSCLFIDGLDEIQDDERVQVIELVELFKSIPNVKTCVTSRPERLFVQNLGQHPYLRVQDLTEQAIRLYVENALGKYEGACEVSESDDHGLLANIVRKSEGVFLWAAMALKDLIKGIEKHGDSWELLKQRIEMYPPNLGELYEQMWIRQNQDLPTHKREAAILFRSVLEQRPPESPLLVFLLANHQALRSQLQQLIVNNGFWSFEDAKHMGKEFETWLCARSAGLLEISGQMRHTKLLINGIDIYSSFDNQVTFIHRSVCEFLMETKYGQDIMSYDDRPTMTRHLAYPRAAGGAAYVLAAQAPENNESRLAMSTKLLRIYNLLESSGREGQKGYREWMPPPYMNHMFLLTVLRVNSKLGNVEILDEIHQKDRKFESLSKEERGVILFECYRRIGVGVDLDISKLKHNTSEQDSSISWVQIVEWIERAWKIWLAILERQMNCVKWLLVHDSDPHLIMKEEDTEPDIFWLANNIHCIRPTTFQLFHLKMFTICRDALATGGRLNPPPREQMKAYITHIIGFVRIFNEYNNGEQRINMVYRGYPPAPNYEVEFSVDIAWFLEVINIAASLDGKAHLPSSITESLPIHIHSVRIHQEGMLRPCAEKIRTRITAKLIALMPGYFLD
ncbi:uncharacterized protein F4817DRAFT_311930 [Daldinia loculata]|uniref:uncharacterized protein n=1 Tax=Daldinia loculata TaxID=103429 RepID=UPI0020C3CDC1|nr:uncharacterized protein F4817DRAFT_311930 [Daldinia loculata]KAI1651102.1 hypothetical protein F4817DRAFT_311930 [Daldinia loculata]